MNTFDLGSLKAVAIWFETNPLGWNWKGDRGGLSSDVKSWRSKSSSETNIVTCGVWNYRPRVCERRLAKLNV